MTYRGTVRNGVVILSGRSKPPEGAEVSVRALKRKKARPTNGRKKKPTTLGERMMRFAGKAKGLPRDFAANHDHYLYGVPKR